MIKGRGSKILFLSTLLAVLGVAALGAADAAVTAGADLSIGADDIRIAPASGGGYDLFIRAKPSITSVLLVESTKDPAMKADNFAYRAMDYNQVNGDEQRILNGKELKSIFSRFSLVSSTPVKDDKLGSAFHIYIPPVLVYGYPWSRSGTVAVGKGTYVNIRTFAKPYADYSGAFKDNPYEIAILYTPVAEEPTQEPTKTPPVDNGTVSSKFGAILDRKASGSLDLVICLDTTASMQPYFDDIKKSLGPMLRRRTAGYASYRIGVVLYKDYWPDEYITRKYPFTADISKIEGIVAGAVIYGGGDIPEALYEALYSAATDFDWSADRRQIIFLTDAAPHPIPKGTILYSDVLRETQGRKIEIDSVIVPESIPAPNPPHELFENAKKKLATMESAGGAPVRILALTGGSDPADRLRDIQEGFIAPLASDSGIQILGSRELAIAPSGETTGKPWFAAGDADALKAAADAGAALLLLCSNLGTKAAPDASPTSAMSQTISRLIDVASGKELARDVAWRVGMPNGGTALFVNGLREK
jgi:hypothetical protein